MIAKFTASILLFEYLRDTSTDPNSLVESFIAYSVFKEIQNFYSQKDQSLILEYAIASESTALSTSS